MDGEQGPDRYFGGAGADEIDAVSNDTEGSRDVIDCGGGKDTVFANGEDDKVADNCEIVIFP